METFTNIFIVECYNIYVLFCFLGVGTNSVASDFKTRVAQIAAAGNKPEDWKEYIDMIKVRAQSMDDYKRNRLITYVYFNAFKVTLGSKYILRNLTWVCVCGWECACTHVRYFCVSY